MGTKSKILGIAVKWLFILCLPVLLVATSLGWAVNSLWLYKSGSQRYNVSQTLADTGLNLSDSELESVYAELIDYFNSDEEYVSITVLKDGAPFQLFRPEEVIHFRDVKWLIWLDYWLFFGTLTYALAYTGVSLFWRRRRYWRRLSLGVVAGSGITIAGMLALGLGTLFDFGQLFYRFHLLFFSNLFWSAEGYMLLLFPGLFFYDAAVLCLSITAGLAVILGGAAGICLHFAKNKTTLTRPQE